jgi:hypothetical protein
MALHFWPAPGGHDNVVFFEVLVRTEYTSDGSAVDREVTADRQKTAEPAETGRILRHLPAMRAAVAIRGGYIAWEHDDEAAGLGSKL